MHDVKNPVDNSIKTVTRGVDLMFNNACEIMLTVGYKYYQKAMKIKLKNVDFKNMNENFLSSIPFTTLVAAIDGDMEFLSVLNRETGYSYARPCYCTDNNSSEYDSIKKSSKYDLKKISDVRLAILPNPDIESFKMNELESPIMEVRTTQNAALHNIIYNSTRYGSHAFDELVNSAKNYTHDNVFLTQSLDQITDSLQGAKIELPFSDHTGLPPTALFVDIDTLILYIISGIYSFQRTGGYFARYANRIQFTKEEDDLFDLIQKEALSNGLIDETIGDLIRNDTISLTRGCSRDIREFLVFKEMLKYMEKSENQAYKGLYTKMTDAIDQNKYNMLNKMKLSAILTAAAWHGSYANMDYGQDVLNLIYNDILKDNANDFELLYRKNGRSEGHHNRAQYIGEQARELTFKLNSVLYMLLKYVTKYGCDNNSIDRVYGNQATPEVFASLIYRLLDAYTEYSTIISNFDRNIIGFDERGRFIYEDTVKLANPVLSKINDPELLREIADVRQFMKDNKEINAACWMLNDSKAFHSTGYENIQENYKAIASICKHTVKSASIYLVNLLEYDRQRKIQTNGYVLDQFEYRLDDSANRLRELSSKLEAVSSADGWTANLFDYSDRELTSSLVNLIPLFPYAMYKFTRGKFMFRANAARVHMKDFKTDDVSSQCDNFTRKHKQMFQGLKKLVEKIADKSKSGTINDSTDGSSVVDYGNINPKEGLIRHELCSNLRHIDGFMSKYMNANRVKLGVSSIMLRYFAKVLQALISEDFIELYQDSSRKDNYSTLYVGAQAEFQENAFTTTTLPVLDSQVPMAFFGQQSSESLDSIVYPLLVTPLAEDMPKSNDILAKMDANYYNYLVEKGVLNDRRTKRK